MDGLLKLLSRVLQPFNSFARPFNLEAKDDPADSALTACATQGRHQCDIIGSGFGLGQDATGIDCPRFGFRGFGSKAPQAEVSSGFQIARRGVVRRTRRVVVSESPTAAFKARAKPWASGSAMWPSNRTRKAASR